MTSGTWSLEGACLSETKSLALKGKKIFFCSKSVLNHSEQLLIFYQFFIIYHKKFDNKNPLSWRFSFTSNRPPLGIKHIYKKIRFIFCKCLKISSIIDKQRMAQYNVQNIVQFL